MTKKKYIQYGLFYSISCLLAACIGEDPNNPSSAPTDTTTSIPSTATTSSPVNIRPGALGVAPAIYTVRTRATPILQHYYTHHYTKNNLTLEQRDEHDIKESIKDQLDQLPKWSENTTRWTDQHGSVSPPPENESRARISNDHQASTLQTDSNHVLQHLEMEKSTGLYIPGDLDNSTTLLVQDRLIMGEHTWIDVRGRMETGQLDMHSGSVIDLTNGYGLSVLMAQKALKYDRDLTQTGVLTIESSGSVNLDHATITTHSVNFQGTLTSRNSTINLQTRRVTSGEPDLTNIMFSQRASDSRNKTFLYAKNTEIPEHVLTINGPAHFFAGSELHLFLGKEKVSTLTLNYPFTHSGLDSEKPTLKGKIILNPAPGISELNTTPSNKPLLIIKSNIGFQQDLNTDQLLTSGQLLRKKLTLQRLPIPSEDNLPNTAEGLYLKISDDSNALANGFARITPPLQQAFQTMQISTLKSQIAAQGFSASSTGVVGKTRISISSASTHDSHKYSTTNSLGVGHSFCINNYDLTINHYIHKTNSCAHSYALTPDANSPLIILNNTTHLERNFKFGSISIKPSIGFVHFMLPETPHQVAFHTLHPEALLSSKLTHSSDSENFCLAATVKALYQTQELQISPSSLAVDVAFSAQFSTKTTKCSLTLINPFHSSAELFLSWNVNY